MTVGVEQDPGFPEWIWTAGGVLLAAVVALREWYYGGSRVSVEIEYGVEGFHHFQLYAPIERWKRGVELDDRSLRGVTVPFVKLTVRNKGRTPATILRPAVAASTRRVPDSSTILRPNEYTDAGETSVRIRLEAHDAREFFFYLGPALRRARAMFPAASVQLRGAVETGTGRVRLSPRWRQARWNVASFRPGQDWIGRAPDLRTRLWEWAWLTTSITPVPVLAHIYINAMASHLDGGGDGGDAASVLAATVTEFQLRPDVDEQRWIDMFAIHVSQKLHSI